MNKRALRADFLLLLTAGIWGLGFVAQRSGMEHVGPFAFNGIRFILGSLFLLPLILLKLKPLRLSQNFSSWDSFLRFIRKSGLLTAFPKACHKTDRVLGQAPFNINKKYLIGFFTAGGCVFVGVMLQQIGIMFTSAGNAGFITGLYVILTPIFGIFLGRKTGPATWFGSAFTLTGLYFLCVAGQGGSVNPGDIFVILSAVFWALHVLLIDRLVQGKNLNPIILSAGQFTVCGVLSLAGAFLAEPFIVPLINRINPALLETGLFSWLPFPALLAGIHTKTVIFPAEALIPILYGGLCSVGIAYTLQVVAQRDAPPAHAAIILCFEGCFAAIGGALLLSEKFSRWTLLGFFLMLAGMLVTQWEVLRPQKKR